MFILCDKVNDSTYPYRVWIQSQQDGGIGRDYSPQVTQCHTARAALSYANGYNSGRSSMRAEWLEIFQTSAFKADADKEQLS